MAFGLSDIKKFLHSDTAAAMARQALGIPVDGEDDTPKAPVIPPPVRTVSTTIAPPAPAIAAPSPAVPPPTRTMIDPGTPPPPSYITDMESVGTHQPVPDMSHASYDPQGNMVGATYPNRNPEVLPTGAPLPDIAPPPLNTVGYVPPPVRNVFVGEQTNPNMTPAEKAAAKVRAYQSDPSGLSKIRETLEGYEAEAPHKISNLKAAGKMFLQRMLAGSQYGLGGMLGAGLEGAVEGGVAPGHAQRVLRQDELQRAQGEQNVAQTLERGQLANQDTAAQVAQRQQAVIDAPRRRQMQEEDRTNAQYERERTDLEQMATAVGNQRADDPNRQANLDAIQTEADRLSQKYGRKVNVIPGEGKAPPRIVVDGEVLQENPDGSLKSIYGSPKTDRTNEYHDADAQHAYQEKLANAQAKRAEIQAAAKEADRIANDYQKKVNEAHAKVMEIQGQLQDPSNAPLIADPTRLEADGKTPKQKANPAHEVLQNALARYEAAETAAQGGLNKASQEREMHKTKLAGVVDPTPPPTRSKPKSSSGLTIEGAISHFKETHKGQEPNAQQIANMQAALQ